MPLWTLHRILIGSAIALSVGFAAWQLARGGSATLAAVSAALAVGLALYYRTIRGRGRGL